MVFIVFPPLLKSLWYLLAPQIKARRLDRDAAAESATATGRGGRGGPGREDDQCVKSMDITMVF